MSGGPLAFAAHRSIDRVGNEAQALTGTGEVPHVSLQKKFLCSGCHSRCLVPSTCDSCRERVRRWRSNNRDRNLARERARKAVRYAWRRLVTLRKEQALSQRKAAEKFAKAERLRQYQAQLAECAKRREAERAAIQGRKKARRERWLQRLAAEAGAAALKREQRALKEDKKQALQRLKTMRVTANIRLNELLARDVAERNKARAASRSFLAKERKLRKRAKERIMRRDMEKFGRLSKGIVARLYRLQGGRCMYCPAELSEAFNVDHYIPLALGGKNEDGNVQLLCPSCNRRKGAKHPFDFISELQQAGQLDPGPATSLVNLLGARPFPVGLLGVVNEDVVS